MPGDEGRLGQGCGGEAFSVGLERSARKAHSCANSKRTVPNGIGGRVFAAMRGGRYGTPASCRCWLEGVNPKPLFGLPSGIGLLSKCRRPLMEGEK